MASGTARTGTVKATSEPNLGDREGLQHEAYPNAKGLQGVKCCECNAELTFNPDHLYWTNQHPFEFVEVQCSWCESEIELTAVDTGFVYDYFTDAA